ncbi:NAD(P)-binding domain-containing protein [Planotetraspora sp. A-T 1434]|uniref:flavin-containing monooxygenase n=1 Tax=Planotetraspora sp. A-T 1434 TaxID=2979219 RepID=UPI0021BF309E|nr:NAD(P)-binding domain-containing protein [Planotetraspora sp. A-T 1434]MCT9934452.1 NAD(P)-binding domain-containing protein [Planotetraspora sp. A-T 1434]
MTKSTKPAYCVIGAGAAGLAALKALVSAGHDVTCFERSDRVGGHWHTDYEALHLITPRDSSGFADRGMPGTYPTFPSRNQMRDYIVDYGTSNGLTEHILFFTEVVEVRPVNGDSTQGWLVATSDGATRRFDGVVVANGHLWDPALPDLAGEFTGVSLHSSEYTNTRDLEGQRVLVVGAGNSGCDLAVDAAQAGFTTSISIRGGRVYQPKTLYGRPRSELKLVAKLPPRLQERVLRELVRIAVGDPESHRGLPKPDSRNLFENLPVVNSLLTYWIDHGRIRVVGEVVAIDGRAVSFADGTTEEFDSILWASGFKVSLRFLEPSALETRGGVPLRVAGGVLPLNAARLFFVGLIAPRGPQLPVYSAQSELLLDLLAVQEKVAKPLAEYFGGARAATDQIDQLRHVWARDMAKAGRLARRLKERPPAAGALHGPARSAFPESPVRRADGATEGP